MNIVVCCAVKASLECMEPVSIAFACVDAVLGRSAVGSSSSRFSVVFVVVLEGWCYMFLYWHGSGV